MVLLIPTESYRAEDFQAAARALEAEVVIGTERKLAISHFTEDRCLVVDFESPERAAEQVASLHSRRPVDAVIGVDDQGVVAAAAASARLGLRGNDPAAAVRTRDKLAMRTALEGEGVPQPPYRLLGPDDDVERVGAEIGWPCVIKPLGGSASRGVIRVDGPEEAIRAAARIRAMLSSKGSGPPPPLLVEGYVGGREVAVEGLLEGGRLRVLAVFDKPDPMEGPFFEETLLVTPSRLPAPILEALDEVTGRAAGALGLSEGALHAELRVDGGGRVFVLELAARSVGGLCARSLRFGTGMALEELILRHALGLPLPPAREHAASGVMMIPIPRAGRLQEVRGREAASSVPGITGLEITIGRERPVRPLPEGDRYLGFIFAKGTSPEAVEASLRTANDRLDVVIDPARV